MGVLSNLGWFALTVGTVLVLTELRLKNEPAMHRRDVTLDARIEELEATLEQLKSIKRGENGLDGEPGPRGYRGPPGFVGKQGPRGSQGERGRDGKDGFCAIYNQTTGEVQVPCPKEQSAADSESVEKLKGVVAGIVRQIQLMQVSLEQRIRYEGGSGVTQVRGYGGGSQPFHEASYTNIGFINMHNHADHKYTIGMGEVAAVLNGVEFWTRHNDYALRQPSSTSTDYHATEEIEVPDVPPEVTAKATSCGTPPCIEEQSEEMRRWFHAWQDQDVKCPSCVKLDDEREAQGLPRFDEPNTERHYQQYFPPVLCYLEGAWIETNQNIDEPFHSDRHFIDAKTWRELYDKNRFMYQSGRKSLLENLPFLPSSIRETRLNDSEPIFANWEYRIVCHRPKDNIPLDRFRVASDMAVQLMGHTGRALTLQEIEESRYARFDLNPRNSSNWHEGRLHYQYIDELMEEIPGKDNYMANLHDDSFGNNATHYKAQSTLLNTGFYSRFYSVEKTDAMGRTTARRGFNDPTMWAAMTSQEKVSGINACTSELVDGSGGTSCDVENTKSQKWTWAIPIEVIYLTPLTKWNPYGIQHCDNGQNNKDCAFVKANGRNGDATVEKAYAGTATDLYFKTPIEFFEDVDDSIKDAADTSSGTVFMLDSNGTPRQVKASGHWIHFPAIKGFEKPVRQRYPIMPIHEQGRTSWKELKALQAMTLGISDEWSADYMNGLKDVLEEKNGIQLRLEYTNHPGVGEHAHTLEIMGDDLTELKETGSVTIISSQDNGHTHQVKVSRVAVENSRKERSYLYEIAQCDSLVNIQLNGKTELLPRQCGDSLQDYMDKKDNITTTINSLNPFAFYTRPENNFDSETGIWSDVSGNDRHSTGHGANIPFVLDVPPAVPALRFNKYSGLKLAAGTVPSQFTIFVRGRYTSKTDFTNRITTAESGNHFFGWHYKQIGMSWINGQRISNAADANALDSFVVSATRNTQSTPVSWLNGQDNSYRGYTAGAFSPSTLTINMRPNAGGEYSDAEVSDVVVFDRHLTTAEIELVNNALMNQPSKPKTCCWDGHAAVSVIE